MAESSRLVTIVGARRRVDTALPGHVPVAELLWDLLDLLDEQSGESAPGWGLTRLGGRVLDLERGLDEQGIKDGAMLFLTDLESPPPPLAFDDYADAVATTVDAQPGRWKPAFLEAVFIGGAAASVVGAGVALFQLGAADARLLPIALAAGLTVSLGGIVAGRWLGARLGGLVLALAAIPLWVVAGTDLTVTWHLGVSAEIAAAFAAASLAALLARLIGPVAQEAMAAILAAGLLPAGAISFCVLVGTDLVQAAALTVVLELAVLRTYPLLVFRVIGLRAAAGQVRLQAVLDHGRGLLAALLAGTAAALAASVATLAVGASWFGLGLIGAVALATALGARHFRFTAEVLALAVSALAAVTALELALVRYLVADQIGVLLVVPVLLAIALVLVGAGLLLRARELSAGLDKRLDQLETLAALTSVPLALGVWNVYADVGLLLQHLL